MRISIYFRFLMVVIAVLAISSMTCPAQDDISFREDVFVGGQDGYNTYRIPAMVISNQGTVLAFCEGRKMSASDSGDIDLLVKRSENGGKNWSKQIVVHEEDGNAPITIGNPCPIIERDSNTIHLLFNRNNKRLFYTKSIDDGLSWSSPKELTNMLKNFDYPLVRCGIGPVHGIQMKNGRLIATIWVNDCEVKDKEKNPTKRRYQSGIIYSDDSGVTWRTGGLVPPTLNRLNECTVLERLDGSLLLNMRAYHSGFRAVSNSSDGGITWSNPVLDKNLPCPTCQACMIHASGSEILFLNPAASKEGKFLGASRRNLTLRLSVDEGRTWAYSRVINQGAAGYSDLAVTKDGAILCLFENGIDNYREKISIVKVDRKWLTTN